MQLCFKANDFVCLADPRVEQFNVEVRERLHYKLIAYTFIMFYTRCPYDIINQQCISLLLRDITYLLEFLLISTRKISENFVLTKMPYLFKLFL